MSNTTVVIGGAELLILPEYLNSLSVFSEVFDAQSLLFCVVISGQLFLFLFAIVSSLFPLLIIP